MIRMGWLLLFTLALAVPAHAGEAIILRHTLTGKAQEALARLVLRFNDAQKGQAGVVLQNLQGLDEATRQQQPLLALLDADDSTVFFGTRPRPRKSSLPNDFCR